jgi:hypothetical protein
MVSGCPDFNNQTTTLFTCLLEKWYFLPLFYLKKKAVFLSSTTRSTTIQPLAWKIKTQATPRISHKK